ncbi:MAG TPA: aldose epimerase family protein [Dongiaceae bacterium]|nr:aldose epimerase family protein [Dongiaceae bacterium]
MTVRRKPFGQLDDGSVIEEVVIADGDLEVSIISWGAVIRDLRYRGETRVLGFDRLEDYVSASPYFGCIAGRYANRIADGRFMLDGKTYQLDLNEGGRTHLHGGAKGFAKLPWQVMEATADSVLLRLVSPDGDQGYPGQVTATCRYRIENGETLSLTLEATTDRPTVINLAAHSYFNLDGTPDTLSHELAIAADHYTPVDGRLIPTGELRAVAGTAFDFRQARPVRFDAEGGRQAYDHNFVVARTSSATPRPVATLIGPESRTRMEVLSTEPGVQFYDGAKLAVNVPGLQGRRYGANAGLCLEPQRFPDTPNHPQFGSAVLRPGETYRQLTRYRFSAL